MKILFFPNHPMDRLEGGQEDILQPAGETMVAPSPNLKPELQIIAALRTRFEQLEVPK